MTVKFKTVITKAGAEKLAAATVPNGKKVNFTAMAVGDGGGALPVPDASQTKLVNEVWRHALNKISQDKKNKNYVVAELLIPPEVGGFWMREMGLYDDTGTLIAVGNMAESYKPALAEGSGRAQTLRMVIMVSDISSVELTIDTSTVMATQEYVDGKLTEHEQSRRHPDATLTAKGFTQLSSATDSVSEVLAATPKAVKTAYDLANAKYTAVDATTARKGLVQLSSAIDSVSEVLAATPKAVKSANDNATAANINASERVSKAGDSMTGTLNQDAVAQATYNLTALSNATTGNKNYLRKMRGGATDTIWHETVQGGEYRLATGSTDSQEELAISTNTGLRVRGNLTSQLGGFYSGNTKKFSFYSSNTSDKNAALRLWGNVDRPSVVELGDDTGYHFYSQRNKDGSLLLQANGAGQFSGYLRSNGEVQSISANSYRIAYGNYGCFWRNDGNNLYLMLTNKGDAYGNYNSLRPLRVSLETGALQSETPFTVGNTIFATKEITAGYAGALAWAEQYKTKAAFFNSYSTTGASEYHPALKQQASIAGVNSWAFSMGSLVADTALSWHLHMKGSGGQDVNYKWDTSGNFSAPGQLIPGSFANFDSRYYTKAQSDAGYMAKTGAYTKAESDARYNLKNTASRAASGWEKDNTTGIMKQWGIATRTADSTRITFPTAFPTTCVSVQLTLLYTNGFHDQNIYVQNPDASGFTYIAGSGEVKVYFEARGY